MNRAAAARRLIPCGGVTSGFAALNLKFDMYYPSGFGLRLSLALYIGVPLIMGILGADSCDERVPKMGRGAGKLEHHWRGWRAANLQAAKYMMWRSWKQTFLGDHYDPRDKNCTCEQRVSTPSVAALGIGCA